MNNSDIPKIIWMYWEQGWNSAPKLVQQCRESWDNSNQDWEVRCLDKDTVLDYFDLEAWMPGAELKPQWLVPVKKWWHKSLHSTELVKTKRLRIQFRSDIIRVNLLETYGGVWADATLFCRQPLDDWIAPYIKQGFFAFSNPGENLALPDKSLPLFLNYFLIAKKGSYIVRTLNQALYQYWEQRTSADQYLYMFKLFNDCYFNDSEFSDSWDRTKKLDAPIPNKGEFDENGGVEFFAWQTPEQLNDLSERYIEMLKNSQAPAFKLSNKTHYSPDNSQCIAYLFDSKQ